jgi:AraC-like DNA-binding protein
MLIRVGYLLVTTTAVQVVLKALVVLSPGRMAGASLGAVQIQEVSGEELEDVARDFSMPVMIQAPPEYRGRLALQDLGKALTLSRTHHSGRLRTVQTPRLAATTAGDNPLRFCLHVGGRGRVHQHDRVAELASGSGVLYEGGRPWELVLPAGSLCMNMQLSRELLPLRSAEITEACARSIDPGTPAMQLLSAYLERLFEVADDLTAPERSDAGRAAIDLLAMALRDGTPSVPGGSGSDDVLLGVLRMHVRNHLADPDLRVEELARRHHVSVRHAYTLFERIGTTPGAYVREQRLLAAQAMLSDPRHGRRAMSDIAAAVGFHELRTFERAFLRQYGMTPSSWRRERLARNWRPRSGFAGSTEM